MESVGDKFLRFQGLADDFIKEPLLRFPATAAFCRGYRKTEVRPMTLAKTHAPPLTADFLGVFQLD
jgi:hypothetical protein